MVGPDPSSWGTSHCVTRWPKLGMRFEGSPLMDLVDACRPFPASPGCFPSPRGATGTRTKKQQIPRVIRIRGSFGRCTRVTRVHLFQVMAASGQWRSFMKRAV